MIQANELRIGNLVSAEDDQLNMNCYAKIETIYQNQILWESITEANKGKNQFDILVDIDPISLTEKWLLKFGGVKRDNDVTTAYMIQNKFRVADLKDAWAVGELVESGGASCHAIIDYVHQLQNLIFALTGEELTLTPNRLAG